MTQENFMTQLMSQISITTFWEVMMITMLIGLILAVIQLIGKWKIFKKAGRKGWEAIIPLYSTWILMVEVAKLNWWWFLILFAPSLITINLGKFGIILTLLELFITLLTNYNIAKKFHKDIWLAILMTFFPVIFYPIIGFSEKYVYDDSVLVSKNGFLDNNQVN